ncbi:hypothetical protein DVA80_21275, partial [Acinetobacter baumannii]
VFGVFLWWVLLGFGCCGVWVVGGFLGVGVFGLGGFFVGCFGFWVFVGVFGWGLGWVLFVRFFRRFFWDGLLLGGEWMV